MNEKIKTLVTQPKTKKYALRFLIAIVIFGLLGFFALPPLIKSVLTDKLSVALHRSVSIEKVSINPYALTARIDGLAINEKESNTVFFSFDKLYLDLALSSIFRGGPVIKEIRLDNPKFNIVRQANQQYNFSDLIDEFSAKPETETPQKPSLFSVNNIQITGGQILFNDQPVNKEHQISEIAITLPFISNMAHAVDTFVEPSFFANVNGAPIQVVGKSKPFANSRESEFSFEVEKLELAKYADYIPTRIPLKVLSGELDTSLKMTFQQEEGKSSTLILSGTSAIRNLDLKNAQGTSLASLKTLDLAIGSADITNERIVIDRISLDSPKVMLQANAKGTLNWMDTFAQSNGAKAAPGKGPFWSVGEIKISNGAFLWKDNSRKKEFNASVEAIELGVQKLSNNAVEPARFNVSWRAAAQEWLNIGSFSVEGGKLSLVKREVSIDKILVKNTKGLIKRAKDGAIEWIEPPALRIAEASQTKAPEPWKIEIAGYTGENIAVRFEDQTVNPAAVQNIESLSFLAENLSTDLTQTAKISTNFQLNKRGIVAVNGTVTPAPIKVDLNIDAKTLELLAFQPYFAERLNVALKRGVLTMKGDLNLAEAAEQSKKEDKSARNLSGRFNGQITLGDVQLTDKVNSADFLRWKSFYVGNIDARYGPESLSISDVALTDFFARLIITPEGKLNLLQMVRKDNEKVESITAVQPEAATAVAEAGQTELVPAENKASTPVASDAAGKKELMPVKIGKVTLQGGEIRFTDNFVKPNYSANLKQIGGSITGLSSDQNSVANLELRGNFDTVAPLNITAKINPLSAKPYLDLQAEIKGVELSTLSSYAGKYAGYAIEKGKLSLAVNYKIENGQLEAQNKLFLDQLTFGEPVDSPEATKLPVTLAVSLLKNRRGEIDLNIPISGSLNDPQFSIGGVVMKIIVNLLGKAITSPFALIGSMFGSSAEELSTVEFDYGYARLTPEMEKRMENLSKALIDRPEVKLEIEGYADAERDAEGAKQVRMERKVRAMKRREMPKSDEAESDATGRRSVEVTPEEYPALLELVYKEEKFPKPRNFVGMVKSLPVEEMEKLILANSVIDEDDMKGLADRRAKVVRDWLVAHELPAERIFLLPGKIVKTEAGGDDNGKKASRVDFKIR